jgi:hypothetical protein
LTPAFKIKTNQLMKKIYLYLLVLSTMVVACKKSDNNIAPTPETPEVKPTMNIKISSTVLFSYNITEVDTVTNDFTVKDAYDQTGLDLSFTPVPGHKILIQASTRTPAAANALAAVVTYKGTPIGTITPIQGPAYTYISYTYVVPK